MKRVALVTGGVGGLGTVMCKKLADAGHTVVTCDINAERASAWGAEMKSQGYDFKVYLCDVTDFEQCASMARQITEEVGPVDILVNNAGIIRDAVFKKLSKVDWDAVIGTNLNSVYNVTKQFCDGMTERGWGRIINMSSVNGQKGQFGQTNYSAAKAGMHGFTKALAQEVARKGVTVNTISPGYIGTEMLLNMKEDVLKQIVSTIPVGRLGRPDEIADLVVYLAGDSAAFITGSNVAINGGLHMF